MFAPVYQIVSASLAVTALLGTNPTRFWPFANAPDAAQAPYVTWQTITGSPENYISGLPDTDSYTLQVDVYARSPTEARNVARALRDAIELHAHIAAWRGESRDAETKLYRLSFDVDWIVQR